jgi:hypothetical protein
MPVTIKVADHDARPFKPTRKQPSSSELLTTTLGPEAKEVDAVIQSSISDSWLDNVTMWPDHNGLVMAAFDAYTNHRNLVIRPEDVWFAVLSQFSFYVNKHSEELRASFVSHEGKKGLVLEQEFPDKASYDFGSMCENMTRLIEQNITDPKLRAWVLPSFTTTTRTDRVVASALMMGMLQKYFDYIFDPCCCGIPLVTLLGEKSDYEDILGRIDKLTEYGREPTHFARLLRPVLRNMIASFDAPPGDQATVEFWSRIADRHGGSGIDNLSGWITAFCLWDADGKCLSNDKYIDHVPGSNSKTSFWGAELMYDVVYHEVDMQLIPSGYVTVPVMLVTDDGMLSTKILAGSIGILCRDASNIDAPVTAGKHPKHTPNEETSKPAQAEPTAQEPKPRRKSTVGSIARQLAASLCGSGQPKEDDNPKPASTSLPTKAKSEQADDTMKDSWYYSVLEKSETLSTDTSATPSVTPPEFSTIQPLSGWWMYGIKDGLIKVSKQEYIDSKQKDWKGGSSTGHVNLDGKMFVRQDQSGEGFKAI